MHGGAAPQVQRSAKQRLLAMVEPIIETWEEIVANWSGVRCTGCGHLDENGVKCVGCGRPTGDPMPVIRIGQLVLDRAGFHPTLSVVHAPASDEFDGLDLFQIADRAEEIAREARRMANAEAARRQQRALPAAHDVQDAVLIDDLFEVLEDGETLWSIPHGDVTKEPESD
jgi:hypothetical protein